MLSKQVIVSALVCTVAFGVVGIATHALLAHDWFYAETISGSVYRPEGPWRRWVIPGTVLEGFACAYLFSKWPRAKGPWGDALHFSFAMGLFFLATFVIIPYGSSQYGSPWWVLGEGLYVVAQMLVVAAALAVTDRVFVRNTINDERLA